MTRRWRKAHSLNMAGQGHNYFLRMTGRCNREKSLSGKPKLGSSWPPLPKISNYLQERREHFGAYAPSGRSLLSAG